MTLSTDIIIIALLVVIVLLICWVIYFEVRLRKLLRGKKAIDLEDSWNTILTELRDVQSARREIEAYLRNVEQRLRRSIQGVETIRFNPFKDLNMGSNQSFSTAFLDEDGNGVVVSSLYSRDRVSVYSKPLKSHASEYGLTEEEREAVTRARPGKIA